MTTVLDVSFLFFDVKDKHEVWFIASMSEFEILVESEAIGGCLFWFVIEIIVLSFGLVYEKSFTLFSVFTFNEAIGGFELVGMLLG